MSNLYNVNNLHIYDNDFEDLTQGAKTDNVELIKIAIKSLQKYFDDIIDEYEHDSDNDNNSNSNSNSNEHQDSIDYYENEFYTCLSDACMVAIKNKSKSALKELWNETYDKYDNLGVELEDSFVDECINAAVITNDLDMVDYIINLNMSNTEDRYKQNELNNILVSVLNSSIKDDNYEIVLYALNNPDMLSYTFNIIDTVLTSKNSEMIKEVLTNDKLEISHRPYIISDDYIIRWLDLASNISFDTAMYLLNVINKHPNEYNYSIFYDYVMEKFKEDV